MKKWFKRGLIALVALVIVTVVGAAIFLLTFDPNAYKSKLENLVQERYGRTLTIAGNIELSLFPRIGLSIQDAALSEPRSEQRFASIQQARVAVAVWPLISNRLVVDHISLQGLKGWVVRDEQGRFNFDDLLQPAEPSSPALTEDMPAVVAAPISRAASAEMHVDIAGLELKQSEIHFRDAASGTIAHITGLDLNTGRMTSNQPFDVSLKGRYQGEAPQGEASFEGQALLSFDPVKQAYSAQKLNVQLNGHVGDFNELTAVLRGGNLAYDGQEQQLEISGLDLQLRGASEAQGLAGLESRLTVPALKMDRTRQLLNLSKVAYRAKGRWQDQAFDAAFDAPAFALTPKGAKGETVTGTFRLEGDGRAVGASLNLAGVGGEDGKVALREVKVDAALKQQDRTVALRLTSPFAWTLATGQGGLSAMKGDVSIEDPALPSGKFEFPFIGSVAMDRLKDELTAQLDAVLSGSKLDMHVKASRLAQQPQIAFKLAADKLDLDAMFPPARPAEAKPADAPAEPAKRAEGAAEPGAAPAPAPAPAAEKPMDLSFLDNLDLTGNITLGELKVRNLQARQASAAIRAVKGSLEISRLRASLYQGTLSGKLSASSSHAFAAELSLAKVVLHELLRDLTGEASRLQGTGSLDLKLTSRGATPSALKAGLNGTVQARLRDGAVRGFNLAQTLREASEALREVRAGKLPTATFGFDMARSTDFSALDADLAFQRGRGDLTKLSMQAPLLRVAQGKPAWVDLGSETMDLALAVTVVNTKTGQGGKDLEVLEGVTVPLRVHGPMASPGFEIVWDQVVARLLQGAVQKGLSDLLERHLPGASGQAAPAAGAGPADAGSRRQDNLRNLEGALKGLLGR